MSNSANYMNQTQAGSSKLRQLRTRGNRLLAYRESGDSSAGMCHLLLPGMGSDWTHMRPIYDDLVRLGKWTVVVELPGHGTTGGIEQAGCLGITEFAEDVAYLADELGIQNAALIGHSMGGVVALECAAVKSIKIDHLILLDPGIFLPQVKVNDLLSFYASLNDDSAFEGQIKAFVPSMFKSSDTSSIVEDVERKLAGMARSHFVEIGYSLVRFRDVEAARSVGVRTLVVVPRDGAFADLTHMAAVCPSWKVVALENTGHYMQLQVPELVNGAINDFIRRS